MSVPSSNRREHDAAVLAEALRNGTVDPRERTLGLRAERDALRAQLQAVRNLHQRREGVRRAAAGSPVEFCSQDGLPWPCPTIIAASAPGVGAAQTQTEET